MVSARNSPLSGLKDTGQNIPIELLDEICLSIGAQEVTVTNSWSLYKLKWNLNPIVLHQRLNERYTACKFVQLQYYSITVMVHVRLTDILLA